MMRKFVVLVLSCFALPAVADAPSPEVAVEYRHLIFESMGRHMKASSMIMKGKYAQTKDVAGHATAMADLAAMIPGAFPKGSGPTNGLKTEALPAIWDNWSEFEKAASTLQTEAKALAELAASGADAAAMKGQFIKVGKACGSCHDQFRKGDE